MNTEQLRNEINKTNASLFRVSFVKANVEHLDHTLEIQVSKLLGVV